MNHPEQIKLSSGLALLLLPVSSPYSGRNSAYLTAVFAPGDQHKRQRKLVNPVFSVAQLKDLMPVFYRISDKVGE